MLREFRQFLLRGNVVDLATGIVIGAAFTSVVNALVRDLITPLIAAVFGQPNFASVGFTINNSRFLVGDFLDALIAFVLVAAAVFFLVIKPINALVSRAHHEEPADPTTQKCPQCLSEIPLHARRCAFCTSELSPAAA